MPYDLAERLKDKTVLDVCKDVVAWVDEGVEANLIVEMIDVDLRFVLKRDQVQ
jgi:hypothetical protein